MQHARVIAETRSDFALYARRCLKILTKKGKLIPLLLNRAQRYAHARIEEQLARTGKVRAIILKGRQQGLSTYITARYYWKATGELGKRVQIMTHLDEATDNLFTMVKRYHANNNPLLKPRVRFNNAKELSFSTLDTNYKVTTAGSKATGRSATIQYYHWSEVAFSPGAKAHMAGVGQAVPDEPGTEVILESTANGLGNTFHAKVVEALAGEGDYELIFIPWFWEDSYSRDVPADATWDDDEIEYRDVYDCTWGQLYWRKCKIRDDFDGDATLFDQEYPADVMMAFAAGTAKALIQPMSVAAAMKRHAANDVDFGRQALVLGVDPGEYGDDPTGLTLRRGRKVIRSWEIPGEGNAQVAGRILMLIKEQEDKRDPIDAIFIDVTGIGTGVEAFLTDAGVQNVYRIHFGAAAIESEKYHNRSAEMWARCRDWFKDQDAPASLPKGSEKLQMELCSRDYDYDGKRRVRLETKEHMRANGKRSPNQADSLVLTFALPVKPAETRKEETLREKLARLVHRQTGSPGMRA
jgi:hypothetical protein